MFLQVLGVLSMGYVPRVSHASGGGGIVKGMHRLCTPPPKHNMPKVRKNLMVTSFFWLSKEGKT
jgi:hypothetical protein